MAGTRPLQPLAGWRGWDCGNAWGLCFLIYGLLESMKQPSRINTWCGPNFSGRHDWVFYWSDRGILYDGQRRRDLNHNGPRKSTTGLCLRKLRRCIDFTEIVCFNQERHLSISSRSFIWMLYSFCGAGTVCTQFFVVCPGLASEWANGNYLQGTWGDGTVAQMLKVLYKHFIPYKVVKFIPALNQGQVHICYRGTCKAPIDSVDVLEQQLLMREWLWHNFLFIFIDHHAWQGDCLFCAIAKPINPLKFVMDRSGYSSEVTLNKKKSEQFSMTTNRGIVQIRQLMDDLTQKQNKVLNPSRTTRIIEGHQSWAL